jgi:hypothetical protein
VKGLEDIKKLVRHIHTPDLSRFSGGQPPLELPQVECLRHLRRADEVIRATKVTLRPIVDGGKLDRETMAAVLTGLDLRLNELDVLCFRPLLFHSEMTFNLVHRLKGKLSYLQGLLQKHNGQEALQYWKDETAEEFRLVLSKIFQEVDALLTESRGLMVPGNEDMSGNVPII